ncbi:chromaffin granule amine transporter-like [Sycon ciliatum]|uniref:chromaffin granule amine transporter-like n=1 Tax=Sycon ciliatum TaxID=27933 RepID=UPI0031F6E4E4
MPNSSGSPAVSGCGRRNDESEKSLLDAASEDDADELHGGGGGVSADSMSPARRVFILVTLATASMSGNLTSIASFYTTAALDKNPGAGIGYHTAIGGVYSIFMVAGAIAVPLFSKDLPNIGSKNLIILSYFITGVSHSLFAFVTTISDSRIFLVFSYCIRILEGTAYVMSAVAVMTYLMAMYPTNLGFVSAFQMTFLAIGHVFGVLGGGAIYDIGGFRAPFLFGGAFNLVVCAALFLSLIDVEDLGVKQNGRKGAKAASAWTILRVPWVWVMAFTLLMANFGYGGVEAVLGARMDSTLHSPAVLVGAVLSVKAIGTSVASPFVGALLDRGVNPPLFIVLGMLCETLGLSLIGPAVFVHGTPPLWLLFVGVLPLSLSNVLMQASSIISMSQHLEGVGVGDCVEMRAAVAGLSRFSLTIGYGLGPAVASPMVAVLGFPLAMTAIGLVYAGMAVLMLPLSWLHHIALTIAHKQAATVNTDSDDDDL